VWPASCAARWVGAIEADGSEGALTAAMQGIVVLGHGTKDPEGTAEFLGYVEGLRRRTGEHVEAGVLEYPGETLPDVQTAFDRAAARGVTDIVGLPALLFFAGHTRDDMPEQLELARARHPELRVTLAGPLGVDERLLRVIEDRLAPFEPGPDTAVLLVGRGSLSSEANADLHKTARMLWDRNRYGWVESCFVSVAPPGVPQGIDRCFRLGARRVLVVPYFLNTGVLAKRISVQAVDARAEVQVASHMGLHPLIFDLFLQRIEEARAGLCPCRAGMGCRMPGVNCAWGAMCLTAV